MAQGCETQRPSDRATATPTPTPTPTPAQTPAPTLASTPKVPMFTLQNFFRVIPHEASVSRLAAQGEHAIMTDFCRELILGIVLGIERPPEASPRRLPGRPAGTFNVEQFARSIICSIVESAMARGPPPKKTVKVYQKWDPAYQALALEIAEQKGSDPKAIAYLRVLFPKVFSNIMESHLRSFRKQKARRDAGIMGHRGKRKVQIRPQLAQMMWAHIAFVVQNFGIASCLMHR